MIAAAMLIGTLTRALFLGATRPQTPRLQSPPQEAGASRVHPRHSNLLRLRVEAREIQLSGGINKEIGQDDRGRYSLQPGGFIFDAHLAHFLMSVSMAIFRHPGRSKAVNAPGVGAGELLRS